MTATANFTSKDVATALDIDAKALRVFLRSGKADGMFTRDGKSYVFTKADVTKLKKAYAAFVAERTAKKAAKVEMKVAANDAADNVELVADDA